MENQDQNDQIIYLNKRINKLESSIKLLESLLFEQLDSLNVKLKVFAHSILETKHDPNQDLKNEIKKSQELLKGLDNEQRKANDE